MTKYYLAVVFKSNYEIINWSKEEKNGQLYFTTELLSKEKLNDMTKLENIIDFTQHFKDDFELKDYLFKEGMIDEVYLYPQYKVQIIYEKDNVAWALSESVPYKSSIKCFYDVPDDKVLKQITPENVFTHIKDIIPQTQKSPYNLGEHLRGILDNNEYLYEQIYQMNYDLNSYTFYMLKNYREDKDLNVKLERFINSYKIKDSSDENYKIFNDDLSDLLRYLEEKNDVDFEIDMNEELNKYDKKTHWLKAKIIYLLNTMCAHEFKDENEKSLEYYKSFMKSLIGNYTSSSLNTKGRYKLGMLFYKKKYEKDLFIKDKRNDLEKNTKKLSNYDFGIDNLDIYSITDSEQMANVVLPKVKENPTKNNIYSAAYAILKNEPAITKESALAELNKILDEGDEKIMKKENINLDIMDLDLELTSKLFNREIATKIYGICAKYKVAGVSWFLDQIKAGDCTNVSEASYIISKTAGRNKKLFNDLVQVLLPEQEKVQIEDIEEEDDYVEPPFPPHSEEEAAYLAYLEELQTMPIDMPEDDHGFRR